MIYEVTGRKRLGVLARTGRETDLPEEEVGEALLARRPDHLIRQDTSGKFRTRLFVLWYEISVRFAVKCRSSRRDKSRLNDNV